MNVPDLLRPSWVVVVLTSCGGDGVIAGPLADTGSDDASTESINTVGTSAEVESTAVSTTMDETPTGDDSTIVTTGDSESGTACSFEGCPCDGGGCDDGLECTAGTCVPIAPPVCGNGIVEQGELCDAGADNGPGRACHDDCMPNVCGDGDPGPEEGCDDGNDVDDDACSNTCVPASCGDGVVQLAEACDDGDTDDTDACANVCALAVCGDGIVQVVNLEECDDGPGNSDNADCTFACAVATCGDGLLHSSGTGSEECDHGPANNGPGLACLAGCVLNVCGDGDHGPAEACDDGNDLAGDGCSPECGHEICGNGVLDFAEECDDGMNGIDDACTDMCTIPVCGDGLLQVSIGEGCDEGVSNADTGACTSGCQIAACGDGLVWNGVEQCDEGEANANVAACKADCTDQFCGDGYVGPGEGCDDANDANDDACTTICVPATCGDGFVQLAEECDEGEANGGAACTNSCTITPCECGFYHDTPGTCADAYPNVLFVDPIGLFSNGECWSQAFTSIEDALAVALPGDELWIRGGTYLPGQARTDTFTVPSGVALYGGFAGNETARNQRNWILHDVYLSGDLSGNGSVSGGGALFENAHHIVTIPNGDGVVIDGVTIIGGYTSGSNVEDGAGVYIVDGDPAFTNVVFTNHFALNGDGGAVWLGAGSPAFVNCTFTTNYATGHGGAFAIMGAGTASFTNSTFVDNTAFIGGAIRSVNTAETSFTNCTFFDNQGRGAVFAVENGSISMVGGSAEDNLSYETGGFLFAQNATIQIHDAAIANNEAATGGGAIRADNCIFDVMNTTFTGHQSWSNDGGAISVFNGSGAITGCEFDGNEAGSDSYGQGGAIAIQGTGPAIVDCMFTENTGATTGGAMRVSHGALISGSVFLDNSSRYGGAIEMTNGSITIVDSDFVGNTTLYDGAALRMGGGTAILLRSNFVENSARTGGALRISDLDPGEVLVHGCGFFGNEALQYGGAISTSLLTLRVVNSVFSGNATTTNVYGQGGAIAAYNADVDIRSSSFASNSAFIEGGSIYASNANLTIHDSILWNSTPETLQLATPVSTTVDFSCIEGGMAGDGNLESGAWPFVDFDGVDDVVGTSDDDLALAPDAVCIDAGDASLLPLDELDVDGDGDHDEALPLDRVGSTRVMGGALDMGAYESVPP